MKCPVCETASFEPVVLDQHLQGLMCMKCGGHWIKSFEYWRWRERNPDILPEVEGWRELEAADMLQKKQCPECFKLLSRYNVGHGTGFTIDRCEMCRGMWFDKNEWEILQGKNLHDEIHFIFSTHWQKEVREEGYEANRERALIDKIGESDFTRAKQFKRWMNNHTEKTAILGYLLGG